MLLSGSCNKKITALSLMAFLACASVGCGATVPEAAPAANENQNEASKEESAEVTATDENVEEATDEQTEESTEVEEETIEIPALRDISSLGCRMGAAVTESELKDDEVWRIITTHFDAVTFGNELKPDALFDYSVTTVPGITTDTINGIQMEVPVISYKRAERMLDKFLEWNEANPDRQIKIRGHVLVWHSQTPEWFFHVNYDKKEDYVDKETMNLRLEWYIKTVLEHFTGPDSKYKDMFYGWDVVNEAVSDSGGKIRTDAENASESLSQDRHGSNSSWWHVYQSDEFIINAFKYANKYAPAELELYYNDYNECNAAKRTGILKLLQTIKDNEGEPGVGTRISAMGMQGHYGMDDPDFSAVQASMEMYAGVVGNVQITEMDISASSEYDGGDDAKEKEYEKQRKRYNMLRFAMNAANEKPDVNLTGLTFWGTVDQYSWLQSRSDVGGGSKSGLPQCPLLFDENYEPKPCFWVFAQ